MPRVTLTDLTMRSLKEGTWFDEKLPAFGIRVGKFSKTWLVMRTQKRIRTTLGHYPTLSLADARTAARKLLAAPYEQKQPAITFMEARKRYIEAHRGRPGTVKEVTRLLTKHFASLNDKPLPSITDTQLSACIAPLKASEALHGFRSARAMFRWCSRPPRRYVAHSPLEGYAAPSTDTQRTRILNDDELVKVWNAGIGYHGAIFRLMILWGTRKGETLALRRDWIQDDTLIIPAKVTKNARSHTIPLTPLASQVMGQLMDGPYFFAGRHVVTAALQPGSFTKLHTNIKRVSGTEGWTGHDLRRTFRSNCARLGVSRDIAERLLNHAQGALDEIYDHHSYLAEKRKALLKHEKWLTKLLATSTLSTPGP